MRKLLVIITLLVAFLIVIVLFTPDSTMGWSIFWAEQSNVREIVTPPADLLAAKARWAANPIKHYGIRVHYSMATHPFTNCWLDMEVIDEIIVRTFEDSCSADGYLQRFAPLGNTVTELFAKFQKETTSILFREHGNPACGLFLGVVISYSSAGYPEDAKYSWYEASPWNLGPQTYKSIYGDGAVTLYCGSSADPHEPDITITLRTLP